MKIRFAVHSRMKDGVWLLPHFYCGKAGKSPFSYWWLHFHFLQWGCGITGGMPNRIEWICSWSLSSWKITPNIAVWRRGDGATGCELQFLRGRLGFYILPVNK